MDRLLDLLVGIKPFIDRETFLESKDLYGEGVVDSLDILMVLDEICANYGVEIGAMDFTKEDFKSVASILELIKRRGGAV